MIRLTRWYSVCRLMNSSNTGAAITDSTDWVEESLEIKVPSHKDVLLYLMEQWYWQECTKNEEKRTSGEKQSSICTGRRGSLVQKGQD